MLLEGGKGKEVVSFQGSPWKVSMMLILTGVRSDLRGIWKKRGVGNDKADCTPFPGRARGAEVFHGVLVSLSSPLSFSVSGAFFFEKLTQDHSCNVSFY